MNHTRSPRLNQSDIIHLAEALARKTDIPWVSRLLRHARRVANASGGQSTADDLVGDMVVILLEKSEQFNGQTAAYITQHCRWHALHRAEAGRTHRRYCPVMPLIADDEGHALELAELLPDPSTIPFEDELIEREEQAERAELLKRIRPHLGRSGRRVLDGLAVGLSLSAIADAHHVSRPAISEGLKSIRRAIAIERAKPTRLGVSD